MEYNIDINKDIVDWTELDMTDWQGVEQKVFVPSHTPMFFIELQPIYPYCGYPYTYVFVHIAITPKPHTEPNYHNNHLIRRYSRAVKAVPHLIKFCAHLYKIATYVVHHDNLNEISIDPHSHQLSILCHNNGTRKYVYSNWYNKSAIEHYGTLVPNIIVPTIFDNDLDLDDDTYYRNNPLYGPTYVGSKFINTWGTDEIKAEYDVIKHVFATRTTSGWFNTTGFEILRNIGIESYVATWTKANLSRCLVEAKAVQRLIALHRW